MYHERNIIYWMKNVKDAITIKKSFIKNGYRAKVVFNEFGWAVDVKSYMYER